MKGWSRKTFKKVFGNDELVDSESKHTGIKRITAEGQSSKSACNAIEKEE